MSTSTVGLNYGDLVLISDNLIPTAPNFIGTPTNQWGITSAPSNATVFQILSNNASNPIPIDPTTQLPLPVNYGQTVAFASPTSLIGYGSTKLPVYPYNPQSNILGSSIVGWTLTAYAQQNNGQQIQAYSIADFPSMGARPSPPLQPANQIYMGSSYKSSEFMSDAKGYWETQSKSKSVTLQLWLTANLCQYNTDCGNTSGIVCSGSTGTSNSGKCINVTSQYSSTATQQAIIGATCLASLGNNLLGQACTGYCNAQNAAATGTGSTACDEQMTAWCMAQYPGTGPDSVPGPDASGQPNICTCIKANLQQTPGPNTAPQCFYPGCAGCPSGTYCTSSMLKQFQPSACTGQCSVVVNCAQAKKCIVDNFNFCANCPTTSTPAGTNLNCGGPTWYSLHWKELVGGIGGFIGLLLLIILFLSVTRRKK